ncbi:copper resistance CopC family protein [Nonomuraea sp. CA-143628]|uniref:copper resistance CopC family protein n=1 Tax=Nonomuraea sp. CA-143628 TaxID=3239997 RepID=UPI003D8FFA49
MTRSTRQSIKAIRHAVAGIGGAVLLLFLTAPPALAHDRLKDSSPADGAKVAQVETIELEFTSRMTMATLVLERPNGENLPLGKPRNQGNEVFATPQQKLEPGRYRLAWRVVSSDGHPISGELRFTVTAPAAAPAPSASPAESSAPPSSSSSAAPQPATSQPPSAAAAAPQSESSAGSGSGGMPGWLWIAVAALVLAGAALFMSGRRKRGAAASE